MHATPTYSVHLQFTTSRSDLHDLHWENVGNVVEVGSMQGCALLWQLGCHCMYLSTPAYSFAICWISIIRAARMTIGVMANVVNVDS